MDLAKALEEVKEEYQNHEKKTGEKEVIDRFGYMFHPDNLDKLAREDFKSFLLMKNNKHWDGIHRQGNLITEDMDKLKECLRILMNEREPIRERLNTLFPKGKPNYVRGLGRAIVTPILMVVYPRKYGVYNSRTEEGLKQVGEYPKFSRGVSLADRYIKVNDLLTRLAAENNISLFALDEVWWKVTGGYQPMAIQAEQEKEAEELSTGFGLETHLQRFLVENWEKVPNIGKKYEILKGEDGELVGELYKAGGAGVIDILARDKNTKDWLVIELKRGQSSDAVVGQALRYIGWVQKNLVERNEGVKGIIIVKDIDEKLKYALAPLKGSVQIDCFAYNVKFSLSMADLTT